jgi:hypothetical protein
MPVKWLVFAAAFAGMPLVMLFPQKVDPTTVLDPAAYLGSADTLIDRALAAFRDVVGHAA